MTDPSHRDYPEYVELGPGARLDSGVVLGYEPGRPLESLRLTIGRDARLRSGTVVYAGSHIGARFETGHHVVLREQCEVGDDVAIWAASVVDYGCRIGNQVKIHVGCYVAQNTVLEDGVFLAPGVMLANDMYPGRSPDPELVGPRIREGAQIGINATLRPAVEVGAGAIVGAGSVVVDDVAPGVVVVGNPARELKRVDHLPGH